MAESGTGVSLDVRQDTSQLLKVYRETTKTLGQISFFKEKVNRGEKLTNKEIKDAHKWLQKQVSLEEKSLAILEKTERTLKAITAQRQKLSKAQLQPGSADFQRLAKTRETENRLRGTQNLLRGETRMTREGAAGLRGQLPAGEQEPGLLQKAAGMFDPETAAIAALIAFTGKQAKKGWSYQKGLRDYSLMGRAGELGGIDKYGNPYGRHTTVLQAEADAWEERNNRWTGQLDSDFDRARRFQMRASLRESGAPVSESEAANALAMTKMGFSEEQITAWRRGAVRGAQDIGTGNREMKYNDLRQVFADAVQLGFSGLRTGEYMDTIRELNESSQKTASNTDPDEFRQTMKEINMVGSAGFMGARGGQVAQILQGALLNPGGGIAGKLLMLRAGGFKGNYWQTRAQLEQGLTPKNLAGLKAQFGPMAAVDPWGAAGAMSMTTGLSVTKSYELLTGRYARTGKRILPKGAMGKYMRQSGISPESTVSKVGDTQGGLAASTGAAIYSEAASGVQEFTSAVTNAAQSLITLNNKLASANGGNTAFMGWNAGTDIGSAGFVPVSGE